MTISADLLSEIGQTLGRSVLSNLTSETAACDLFEVYILTLLLRAAHREGATISYENVFGQSPPPELIFRTSPGQIFSTERNYTHAVLQFPTTPALEAHVGIKVLGRSGVMHECDVAVLMRDEAI